LEPRNAVGQAPALPREEDHPLEYADFEGVFPEGEYGAGAVIVCDRSAYRDLRAEEDADPSESMEEAIEDGDFEECRSS